MTAKQKARLAEEKAEREAIHALLVEVVNDVTANTSDRLHAAELILQGY